MEIKNPVIQTSKLSKAYGVEHAVRIFFAWGSAVLLVYRFLTVRR